MRKKIALTSMVIMIALFAPACLWAQDTGDLPPLSPVNDVPFDGGLSILLAAGVGYGIKKVKDSRKEKDQADILSK